MVSGSMARGCVRIGASPSQNGSTINDQIAGPNELFADGQQDGEHEEGFMHWGSCGMTAFTRLRFERDTDCPFFKWKSTTQRQLCQTYQPVVHVLIGQPPQGAQQSDEQERFFAVGPLGSSWPFWQWGR